MFNIKEFTNKGVILLASLLGVFLMNTAIASEGFDSKEKAIITIAAFAAIGEIDMLKVSLNYGL